MEIFNATDLHTLNNEMASIMTPVIVAISVFLFLGLLGNPLVLLYYGCHGKPTPSYNFIVAMAFFNIMICCISMPMEIVDMMFIYEFPGRTACKFFRFVNYFASFSSGGILTAIAVDRYRKVCQPFKRQITTRTSKLIIVVSSSLSFCLACPSLLFNDVVSVETGVSGIVGYDCTSNKEDYKLYITVFNLVCFLVLITCILTLIVLYILIGRKLVRLKKFQALACASKSVIDDVSTPTASSSETKSQTLRSNSHTVLENTNAKIQMNTEQSEDHIESKTFMSHDNDVAGNETHDPKADCTNLEKESKNKIRDTAIQSAYAQTSPLTLRLTGRRPSEAIKQKKIKRHYIHLRRYTILMFSITAAFIISFVPHLGVATWRALVGNHIATFSSNSEHVAFNICIRSWLLGSAVNPFIYGFFNTNFRLYVWVVIKRGFCCCVSQYKCTNIWNPGSKSREETSHNS